MKRRRWLAGAAACAGVTLLGGCDRHDTNPMSIGAHPFPGYELLYLARHLGLLSPEHVQLVETPSASANLRALGAGALAGAGLTLDEVLSAREQGIDLAIVAVLDRSLGADVVIGRPGVDSLADLKGRRIGVEESATGAVMLDATLRAARLTLADVTLLPIPSDRHEEHFVAGSIDALVTYEPVRTRLLARGGTLIFSSSHIPGRIIDTLALRRAELDTQAEAIGLLVDAHFAAREAWLAAPARHAAVMARRLHLDPAAVPAAFAGLELTDRTLNRELFKRGAAALGATAAALGRIMTNAHMLQSAPDLRNLFDGRFV